MDFWRNQKTPIFCLSPMEDVTDTVFREIVIRISNPEYLHIVFTEFTSTDGLCHDIGSEKVRHRLFVCDSERKLLKENNIKIVAQIWGTHPEKYAQSIKMIQSEMEFDGIDINMGCPVKKIIKGGSCSELIKNPSLAKEIILASKETSNLPVSVKTRTGIKEHITETWLGELLETNPSAIILHGRTQKMLSEAPANWEEIGKAVRLRNSINSETLIIGNGDIYSMNDAFAKIEKYQVDGVLIGRGIFTNPWFFNREQKDTSIEDRISLLWKHVSLFDKTWHNTKSFELLKRFFKIYISNFPGAHEFRAELMNATNIEDVRKILDNEQNRIQQLR